MEIILILAVGAMNILCFTVGARVGQRVAKGEEVEVPSIKPMEVYREHTQRREERKAQERSDAILRNIEAYDGTSYGQEEIPG